MAMEGQGQMPSEAAPQGGDGSQLVELITSISDGLAMLVDAVNSSGIAPDVAQKLDQINSQFQQVMDSAMSGGGGGGQAAPAGVSSPEAAGAMAQPAMR